MTSEQALETVETGERFWTLVVIDRVVWDDHVVLKRAWERWPAMRAWIKAMGYDMASASPRAIPRVIDLDRTYEIKDPAAEE